MSRTVTPSTRFLMMFTRPVVYSTLFFASNAIGRQRNQSQDDRANAGRDEVIDPEAGDQPGRQLEDDSVQDDQKKTEREDGQRKREDEEDRLDDRVQEPENEGRDGERRPRSRVESGHELHEQEQSEGVDEPADEQVGHSVTSV